MAAGGAEEHFAKKLASNEKKVRDRAVVKLRAWLGSRTKDRSEFDELDLLKIWKGLFYCMWMSDKPLIQEELAVNISLLIHSFKSEQSALLFIKTFFITMEREWHGIDRLRLDKFYLLIRFFVKETFYFLKENNWKESLASELSIIYKEGPLCPTSTLVSDGICLHVSAIYLSELRIAMDRKERPDVLLKLLDPLFFLAAHEKNKAVVCAVKKSFFESIVDCNRGNAAENHEHTPLQVDIAAVIERLFYLASDRNILSRNRNKLFGWIKRLRKLSKEQEDPSGVKENGVTESDIAVGMKRKDAPSGSCDKGSITNKRSKLNNNQTGGGKPKRIKKGLHVDEENNNWEESGHNSNNCKLSTKEKANQRKKGPNVVVWSGDKTSSAAPMVKLKCKKNKRKFLFNEKHKLMHEKMAQGSAKNESGKTVEMNTDNKEEKVMLDAQRIITNGFSESGTSVLNGDIENSEELPCKLLVSEEQMKVSGKKKSETMEPFAKFQKNFTPSAFVRKSHKKTPKTDPRHNRKHKLKDLNQETKPAQKRVRIEVSKNTLHSTKDYKRSLKESPKIPFDALKAPIQGLLKSPPLPTRTSLHVVKCASFVGHGKKDHGKINLNRSTAVDFF